MSSLLEKIRNDEVEYREVDAGLVNTTYITGDRVLQMPSEGGSHQLRKSRYLLNRMEDAGVLVPAVIEYSEDPLFAVFERVEGRMLEDRAELGEEYLEAVRNAGQALAEIHGVEADRYGEPDPYLGFQEGDYGNWQSFTEDYVQGTLDMIQSDVFQPLAARASSMLDADVFPEQPDSRVLHLDFKAENIIIDAESEPHIIDFDDAKYGDPRLDLMYARFLMSKKDEEVEETFMQGYRDVRDPELTDEIEENYSLLALMRDLRGAEWCLKNDRDVDLEDWRRGLEGALDRLES